MSIVKSIGSTISFTLTNIDAEYPLFVVTVTVACPSETPVIFPEYPRSALLTSTISELLEYHEKVVVALIGSKIGVTVQTSYFLTDIVSGKLTPVGVTISSSAFITDKSFKSPNKLPFSKLPSLNIPASSSTFLLLSLYISVSTSIESSKSTVSVLPHP